MDERRPIYRILLFSKIPTLNSNMFPDWGTMDDVGFYYELETAIQAMHENWCDLREFVFDAGLIVKHLPGLYESAATENRIYFEWDEDRKGFFEKEEPECLEHYSF